MEKLNEILKNLGISKVKLAEYLGVSRQMIYNYLSMEDFEEWPKDKKMLIFKLLDIKSATDLDNIVVDADYILDVEKRFGAILNDYRDIKSDVISFEDMKKEEKELFINLVTLIKENMVNDHSKSNFKLYTYLYNFLQAMETTREIKYMIGYVTKAAGFTDPKEFMFNEEEQFIFEGIMYSAMTLFNNGGTSRSKIALTHKRFVEEITHKKEEKLSRTQELNTAKVQALRELGYDDITGENASEVLAKIAEIQSRKI